MTQRYTFGGGVLNIGLDEQEILKGLESNRNYISLLRKISNNLAIEIKRFTPVDTGNLRRWSKSTSWRYKKSVKS